MGMFDIHICIEDGLQSSRHLQQQPRMADQLMALGLTIQQACLATKSLTGRKYLDAIMEERMLSMEDYQYALNVHGPDEGRVRDFH